jgi:Leucine-rich repeat (LRR) protein
MSGCPVILNQVVYFPDQALDSAVRAALNRPFGFLSKTDVLELRSLDAPNLGIASLEGLEHCRYLTQLDLRSNNVTSIRELADLHELRWLDLGDNNVRDIEPLSGLLFLEFANLFGDLQEIWDFTPLAANANATDSSLPGGVLVLPSRTTLDGDGGLAADFQVVYDQLVARGVTVIIADANDVEVTL